MSYLASNYNFRVQEVCADCKYCEWGNPTGYCNYLKITFRPDRPTVCDAYADWEKAQKVHMVDEKKLHAVMTLIDEGAMTVSCGADMLDLDRDIMRDLRKDWNEKKSSEGDT